MPRQARIDAPGAVHHIIARGIERRQIFRDDTDRNDFVRRLGEVVIDTQTRCYAWALIPNHFHLLLKTGSVPVATVMRRLLTGYAIAFNRRHRRSGHLFQNRYKSILCEEDPYLKELLCYIHLNPLRARVVKDLKALDRYRYTGHSCLIGSRPNKWQAVDDVLSVFSARVSVARRRYRLSLKQHISQGRRPELVGGGLVRSAGGWDAVRANRKTGIFLKSDERILGGSQFVETVLADAQESMQTQYRLAAMGIGFDQVVSAVCELLSIEAQDLVGPSKERTIVKARKLVCYWSVRELGMTMTDVAGKLAISVPTVSMAVKKGSQVVRSEELVLAQVLNVEI